MGGGGGFTGLAHHTTAASPQITMEIHISNWTHKFQNRTGLDANTNSELYKSNRVCSVEVLTKCHNLELINSFVKTIHILDKTSTKNAVSMHRSHAKLILHLLTLIRMTKDEKGLAFFKGLLL